jgi:hypothetical protein
MSSSSSNQKSNTSLIVKIYARTSAFLGLIPFFTSIDTLSACNSFISLLYAKYLSYISLIQEKFLISITLSFQFFFQYLSERIIIASLLFNDSSLNVLSQVKNSGALKL